MLLLLFALSLASTNLIQNGGFEDHASKFCSRLWCPVKPEHSKLISPWKVTDTVRLLGINPHNGTWAIILNYQQKPGSIEQTVATKPNSNYALKFWLHMKSHCGLKMREGIIQVVDSDGSIILEEIFMFDKTEHGKDWREINYDFKAKSEESKIVLGGIKRGGGTTCGLIVDSFELYEKTTNKKCKKRTPPKPVEAPIQEPSLKTEPFMPPPAFQ